MEKFEPSSTIELKAHNDYFKKDTATDGDTVTLFRTAVIWSMSQNVIAQDNPHAPAGNEETNYPLLLAILTYVAIRNPIGTVQTLTKYAKRKLAQIYDAIPDPVSSGIISTSYPTPAFPPPSVTFIHTTKTTTPDRLPPQL